MPFPLALEYVEEFFFVYMPFLLNLFPGCEKTSMSVGRGGGGYNVVVSLVIAYPLGLVRTSERVCDMACRHASRNVCPL